MRQTSRFEEVLENVEALSVDEQEVLIDVVRRRLVFNFVGNLESGEEEILLIDIGTHEQVY